MGLTAPPPSLATITSRTHTHTVGGGGGVLNNAISSSTITLTIFWWSAAEALWDIDSPHPETAP